nr:hypothetical protein 19.t00012 [Asparagus officinalis]
MRKICKVFKETKALIVAPMPKEALSFSQDCSSSPSSKGVGLVYANKHNSQECVPEPKRNSQECVTQTERNSQECISESKRRFQYCILSAKWRPQDCVSPAKPGA